MPLPNYKNYDEVLADIKDKIEIFGYLREYFDGSLEKKFNKSPQKEKNDIGNKILGKEKHIYQVFHKSLSLNNMLFDNQPGYYYQRNNMLFLNCTHNHSVDLILDPISDSCISIDELSTSNVFNPIKIEVKDHSNDLRKAAVIILDSSVEILRTLSDLISRDKDNNEKISAPPSVIFNRYIEDTRTHYSDMIIAANKGRKRSESEGARLVQDDIENKNSINTEQYAADPKIISPIPIKLVISQRSSAENSDDEMLCFRDVPSVSPVKTSESDASLVSRSSSGYSTPNYVSRYK